VPVPVDEVLLEVSVRAAPAAEVEFARRAEDVTVRGAAGAAEGGPRGVDPVDAGADCGDATVGFGEVGFSQDEKKIFLVGCVFGLCRGLGGIDAVDDDAVWELGYIFLDPTRELLPVQFGHATCVLLFDIRVAQ